MQEHIKIPTYVELFRQALENVESGKDSQGKKLRAFYAETLHAFDHEDLLPEVREEMLEASRIAEHFICENLPKHTIELAA